MLSRGLSAGGFFIRPVLTAVEGSFQRQNQATSRLKTNANIKENAFFLKCVRSSLSLFVHFCDFSVILNGCRSAMSVCCRGINRKSTLDCNIHNNEVTFHSSQKCTNRKFKPTLCLCNTDEQITPKCQSQLRALITPRKRWNEDSSGPGSSEKLSAIQQTSETFTLQATETVPKQHRPLHVHFYSQHQLQRLLSRRPRLQGHSTDRSPPGI